MTNFKNKKLSQIEEEEEGVSNLDDAKKSHLTPREREMQTGINNNTARLANQFRTALAKSRKKTAVPLLKSGFKTAYQGNLEKFLTNGDMDIMKNLNTMQVNGKNFHLFQTIKKSGEVPLLKQNQMDENFTAEEGVLKHIREDSVQRFTMGSFASRPGSSMRNLKGRQVHRKERRFLTGDGLLGLAFRGGPEAQVYQMQTEQTPASFQRFYTKKPFARNAFKEEEPSWKKEAGSKKEAGHSASISVTNNEITNNNQSVSINNKMNTFIIIVNDKKQEKFLSEQLQPRQPQRPIPKANSDPQKAEKVEGAMQSEQEADPILKINKQHVIQVESREVPGEKEKPRLSTEVMLKEEDKQELPPQLKSEKPIEHVVLNGVGPRGNRRKRRSARFA